MAIDRSRKLPWVKLARISQATQLLAQLDADGIGALVRAVTQQEPQIAELTIQCYDLHESGLVEQCQRLEQAGFAHISSPRSYVNSLRLSLIGSQDALFARLSASARRNVRQLSQHGYAIRALTDEAYAPRLAELVRFSHERTGGHANDQGFATMIRSAVADPSSSVVLGVFHPSRAGVQALVGFAQGTRAPSAATYAVAGTERADDIGRAPLSYGLLWELLVWGRTQGLAWFDFGGVTAASDPDNPLTGISEFKRKFGGESCRIAAEYRLVVNPAQERLLRVAAQGVRLLRARD